MSIQHISTFEDFRSNGGNGTADITRMIGWVDIGTNTSNLSVYGTNMPSTTDSTPTNNDLSSYASVATSGTYTTFKTIQRVVVDNNKLIVAGGCKINRPSYLKQTAILSIGGSNKLSFGLNGNFAAIYINDTLAATSTVNVVKGKPWFFVELFQNKSTGRVYLRINGTSVADVELPSGHTSNAVIVDFGRPDTSKPVMFSEVMIYDTIDPMGSVMVHEFFKTGTAVKQFSGSDSIPNNRPWAPTSFLTSETLGAEDRWTYNNILPNASVPVTSIVAVVQKAVAASGGVSGGSLNLRLRVGSTNYDTSVSSELTSTTPVLVQKVWETNPETSTAWTRSDVQAIQTGYVVAT